MADVRFNVPSNMNAFIGYGDDDEILLASPTELRVGEPGVYYDAYYGTGFTYDLVNGIVTGGTATGFTLFEGLGTDPNVEVTGLSVSAVSIYQKIVTRDFEGLKALLLAGDDSIQGSPGDDLIQGYAGNDRMEGRGGNDTMEGGAGNDTYAVRQSGDVVRELAGQGVDFVQSFVASYTLPANVENGRILADGAANLTGNNLANILFASGADNVIDGGTGVDRVSYIQADAGVRVSLATKGAQNTAGSGTDTLVSIESITGSGFADRLIGNSIDNRIAGDAGADIINGGNGNDSLTGGPGSDSFRFTTPLSASGNVDRISDFRVGTDRIQLDNAIFTKLGATGALNPEFFVANAAGRAVDANDYIVYDTDSGSLFYDADGSGPNAAVRFGALTGLPDLGADSIFVI